MPLPKKNNSIQGYSPLFGDPNDNPNRHEVVYPDGSKTTVDSLDPNDRYREGNDPNMSEIYKKTYERYGDKKKPAWYNKDGEPIEDKSNNNSEDTEKVEKKKFNRRNKKTEEELIKEERELLKKNELRRKEKAEEEEKSKSMSEEERKQ